MRKVGGDQESLGKKVYESLRDAIILGELAPGSLHSVQSLAASLEISRTPVREALLKLADQGMVRFERNRGTRILQTTTHDLKEMFSLRLLLEVPAAYRAAQQAGPADLKEMRKSLDAMRRLAEQATTSPKKHLEPDARFHRAIIMASGSKRIAGIVDNLFALQMARGVSTWGINRSTFDIYADHERIFERISAQDALGASEAMRDHLSVSARMIIAQEIGSGADPSLLELPFHDVLDLVRRGARAPG